MDDHLAAHQVAGVDPADGVDREESLVVDVGDDEADLVHVGRQHDLGFAISALEGDDVAEGIGVKVIGQRLELFLHQGAHLLLATGDPGGVAEFL